MDSDVVGIAEAAKLLGVHPNTVRYRLKTGVYTATKVLTVNGEAWVIPRSQLFPEQPPAKQIVPSTTPAIDDKHYMLAELEWLYREQAQVPEELAKITKQLAELHRRANRPWWWDDLWLLGRRLIGK